MANPSEKKQSGVIALVMAFAMIGAVGFGMGIGARMTLQIPQGQVEPAPDVAAGSAYRGVAETMKAAHSAAGDSNDGEGKSGDAVPVETIAFEEPQREDLKNLVVTPIEPVLTNLGNPKSVWVRLEGSILSRNGSEVPSKVLAAQAGQQIMAYLRTVDLKQIEGASGLLHLNEDLNEVMQSFSEGQVRQVLISGLIVE
jgi:hypothetical protein